MKHDVPCPKCGHDDWFESDEDYGSLGDGGSYVKYKCKHCGYETGWQMLPD
jgi:predicted nucleic-acid-binding Zn-ribbon protein